MTNDEIPKDEGMANDEIPKDEGMANDEGPKDEGMADCGCPPAGSMSHRQGTSVEPHDRTHGI